MLGGKPLESPKSSSRISIFWATLDNTLPADRAKGQQAAFKGVCANVTLPPWPGTPWTPGTSPVLHTPLYSLLCLESPAPSRLKLHLPTKAGLGHTPVCGLTHTHLHVCQITPFSPSHLLWWKSPPVLVHACPLGPLP